MLQMLRVVLNINWSEHVTRQEVTVYINIKLNSVLSVYINIKLNSIHYISILDLVF